MTARTRIIEQPQKSVDAQHVIEVVQNIHFEDTEVFSNNIWGCYTSTRSEVCEIEQHPENINRDDGLKINRFWEMLLRNKQRRRTVLSNVNYTAHPNGNMTFSNIKIILIENYNN